MRGVGRKPALRIERHFEPLQQRIQRFNQRPNFDWQLFNRDRLQRSRIASRQCVRHFSKRREPAPYDPPTQQTEKRQHDDDRQQQPPGAARRQLGT